ncbi:hypothetical protein JTE90_002017 [Oedothorax gibbosus]|uniref:Galectin n=1 Tax=Oedothorax gibbosus TaxID=931172 RepID=A0AAV6UR80_9ARAC|nr:hypothetical protein JTE90_002017 [Oedothorax gibbosus]
METTDWNRSWLQESSLVCSITTTDGALATKKAWGSNTVFSYFDLIMDCAVETPARITLRGKTDFRSVVVHCSDDAGEPSR